jgi:hypothetical protein
MILVNQSLPDTGVISTSTQNLEFRDVEFTASHMSDTMLEVGW